MNGLQRRVPAEHEIRDAIPIDIQEQSIEEDEIVLTAPEGYRPRAPLLTDPELVRKAVAVLRGAQKPLIVAGSAAGYTLSGNALQRFMLGTRQTELALIQAWAGANRSTANEPRSPSARGAASA